MTYVRYRCWVCEMPIVGDPHTHPENGEDICAGCCPKCAAS